MNAPPPRGLSELLARFEHIEVRGGAVVGPPGWEARHMVTAANLPLFPGRLYVNRAIEEPLRAALVTWSRVAPGYALRTIGCFAPRPKRGNGEQLSVHSWGLAVDINAAENPRGAPLVTDIPPAVVEAFTAIGWTWGGRFATPDPMHFQWCVSY